MRRIDPGIFALLITCWTASCFAQALGNSAVGGVVKDPRGVPQLGALVELMGPGSLVVASTYTDDHGRYALLGVHPGLYQLRTSAIFLLPSMRRNLHLFPGGETLANVTLSALFDAGDWFSVKHRGVGEPSDDWQWTMRSSAERPLLRLAGSHENGGITTGAPAAVLPESGDAEGIAIRGEWDILFGSSGVLEAGLRQTLRFERPRADGEGLTFQATVGTASGEAPEAKAAPSFAIRGELERRDPVSQREIKAVVSARSEPSVHAAGGSVFEAVSLATGERIGMGNLVTIDAGTLLSAERVLASRVSSSPFFRVAVHPQPGMTIVYRYAGSQTLQSLSDMDEDRPETAPLVERDGRPLGNTAAHQELAVVGASERNVATVAVYRDVFRTAGIEGVGAAHLQALDRLPFTVNAISGTFVTGLPGYTGRGITASYRRVLTPLLKASLQADYGATLALRKAEMPVLVTNLAPSVSTCTRLAVTGELAGVLSRTHTTFQARYHWQPRTTLDSINTFDLANKEAYASLFLRQRLWSGRRLHNVNAVLEATNLLEEGYQPVVGPDGETLFLAQVPRALQAGLTFSF